VMVLPEIRKMEFGEPMPRTFMKWITSDDQFA
jgi:hypothetical protein